MNPLNELTLMFVATLAAVFASAGPVAAYVRGRREREYVDYLAGDEPAEAQAVQTRPLDRRLRAAGLSGPAEAYMFGVSVLATVVTLGMLRLMPVAPLAALVGGALAVYLPWAAMNEVARRRAVKFEQQMIDAIDLATGTLQAGGSLGQALRGAASVAKEPLRGEFEEAFRRLDLGMPTVRAFTQMAERYDSEGVRLFTLTLVAKLQAGGDLAPVLRALNETLRDRWRQQRQVRAQLAGARMTAGAVVVAPYLLAPVLAWLQPGWFGLVLNQQLGPAVLFFAVVTQLVGILWLWRILSREL